MAKTTTTLQMVLEADDKASTKMQRLAAQLENVGTKYGLQQRAAAQLQAKMDALDKTTDKGIATAGRLQLQMDKLSLSMKGTEQQGLRITAAMSAEAAGGTSLTQVIQQLAAAQTQMAGATGQAESTIRQQVSALQAQAQAMQQSNAATGQGGAAIDALTGKLVSAAKGYLGVQAVQQGWDWGKQGAAIQDVSTSFDKLAVSAGTTSSVLLAEMQKASKGTIANSDLMQKANQAILLTQGRLASELPRLLAIAGASAKATGQSVNEAFDSLVLGLSRSSKMIIDNLGFTIDVGKANEDYANSIGVSVNALNDQQKAIAFQNAVLSQGDALVTTLGTSTLTSAEKIAQAEARIKNFTDSLKVMAGEGIAGAIDGLTYLNQALSGNAGGDVQAQALAATAQTYEQYVAAIQSGNDAMLQSTTSQQAWLASLGPLGSVISGIVGAQQQFVGTTQILTEEQYNLINALTSSGMASEDAAAKVTTIAEAFASLEQSTQHIDPTTGTIYEMGTAAGISSEQLGTLRDRAMEVAEISPAAATAVAGLTAELQNGEMPGMNYAAVLEIIAAAAAVKEQQDYAAAEASFWASEANAEVTVTTYEVADATYELTDAQAEQANVSAEAELAALQLADTQAMMEQVVLNVQNGVYSQADALAILQAQFGLSEAAAQRFLAVQLALNAALGKQTSIANMGKLVNVGGKAYEKQLAEQQRSAERAGAQARREADRAANRAAKPPRAGRSGGGGRAAGAGKKAGKSPEVKQAEDDQKAIEKIRGKALDATEKYLNKQRELEQDHAEKVKAINDKANADREAATKKLQDDQIQGRAGFYQSLVGMDIADQQAAKARYEEHWRIRGELAAAGKQKEADAYMAAADEELQADLQRNAEIKAAREELNQALMEGDAARVAQLEADIANLEYSDKLLDDAAAARLEQLKNANDSIAEEQARALEEENQNFSEAGAKLKEEFDSTLADISEGFGTLSDAARTMAESIIASAAEATAAVNAIPMPSASGAEAGEAPQGSYATGTGNRGLPRTGPFIGHAGEIILNGRQSEALRRAGGVRALDQGRSGVIPSGNPERRALADPPLASTPSTAAASSGNRSSITTSSSAVTVAPGAVVIQAGNANPAQIAALVGRELQKFTRATGSSAASRNKMGY